MSNANASTSFPLALAFVSNVSDDHISQYVRVGLLLFVFVTTSLELTNQIAVGGRKTVSSLANFNTMRCIDRPVGSCWLGVGRGWEDKLK